MQDQAMIEDQIDERNWRAAAWLGWRQLCPSCGKGPLFSSFLKVRDCCVVCREDLHHHRADDGPAWATILIAGHLMAPLMLLVFEMWRPEGWVMALGFSVAFTILSLYLLPRIKGVFVGVQWAQRLFGFSKN